MAYKNLKLVPIKKKYKTRYWVILPHYTHPELDPQIRRYKPDIDGKNMKCWLGYDYVQGAFNTYAQAQAHVKHENKFRRA